MKSTITLKEAVIIFDPTQITPEEIAQTINTKTSYQAKVVSVEEETNSYLAE